MSAPLDAATAAASGLLAQRISHSNCTGHSSGCQISMGDVIDGSSKSAVPNMIVFVYAKLYVRHGRIAELSCSRRSKQQQHFGCTQDIRKGSDQANCGTIRR